MNNIRTQRTRAALKAGLLSCMKEKPLKEIIAIDISRRAGVDRATFYRHYKSVDDIASELEQEQLDLFRSMLSDRTKSGEEFLWDILKSIDEAEELYHVKENGTLPERFKQGLVSTALETGETAWKERIPGVDKNEAELAYEALLGGALQTALSPKTKTDREMVVKIIIELFHSYISTHKNIS